MIEIVDEKELIVMAKDAIQDILAHSDQISNPECLGKARAFLKRLEKVPNAVESEIKGSPDLIVKASEDESQCS
jgi:hypothetical protein